MTFLRWVSCLFFLWVGVACLLSAWHESVGWTLLTLAALVAIWEALHRRRST